MKDFGPILPASVKSEFLSGLEPPALDALLAAARVRHIERKHIVFATGDPATHCFLLRAGRVQYHRTTKSGDDILLRWLLPGDVFGVVSLLKNPPTYIATAETVTRSEVLVWNHATIRKLAQQYPQLVENGLRIAVRYLKNYSDRHVRLVSKTAEHRLAVSLLKLGHGAGQVHPHGIEVDVTNEQISSLADISPFTASRVLNEWQRAGHVSKKRGRIVVHSPEALVVD